MYDASWVYTDKSRMGFECTVIEQSDHMLKNRYAMIIIMHASIDDDHGTMVIMYWTSPCLVGMVHGAWRDAKLVPTKV